MTDYEVWINYMVGQCVIKNYIHWYGIDTKGVDDNKCNMFPVLGVKTKETINKEGIEIKSFDEFCEGDDERLAETLKGRRWRLKQKT